MSFFAVGVRGHTRPKPLQTTSVPPFQSRVKSVQLTTKPPCLPACQCAFVFECRHTLCTSVVFSWAGLIGHTMHAHALVFLFLPPTCALSMIQSLAAPPPQSHTHMHPHVLITHVSLHTHTHTLYYTTGPPVCQFERARAVLRLRSLPPPPCADLPCVPGRVEERVSGTKESH